jgi:hypothetical protein
MGDHQNIREDDRGVEAETAYRLQGDFGGIFRREAKIEEAACLGSELAVFREIPAGLPHHPDRGRLLPAAGQHFKEWFNCRHFRQVLGPGWQSGGQDETSDTP